MPIHCVGLSHRTAPVELRERLTRPGQALAAPLRGASGPLGLVERVVLSTCNRVELYAAIDDAIDPDPRALEPLADLFADALGAGPPVARHHTYHYAHAAAAHHLGRVAAGLDSMVLGETEILGQVAAAHREAVRAATAGPVLSAMFQAAIRAGRRARAETRIGFRPASVATVAVQIALEASVRGDTSRVLIVGAGRMAAKAVTAFRARGIRTLRVINRTPDRAATLTGGMHGGPYDLGCLPEALASADIVVTATAASEPVIAAAMLHIVQVRRRGVPLMLVDMAVPRDIEPSARTITGIRLFDLDELQHRVGESVDARRQEVPRVEAIVADEIGAFERWYATRERLRAIRDLRRHAESIRTGAVSQARSRLLRAGHDGAAGELDRLSRTIVDRLLHEPTRLLRSADGDAAELFQLVRRLYGLSSEPHGPEPA